MGTEYIIVDLDKKEMLDFDKLGFGTKLGSMTSEPIACVLSWLLINPEGYVPPLPAMFGKWAGDRIEIIGDEEEISREQQRTARKDFLDITFDTITGFAASNSAGRVFKEVGLIDKSGMAVVNPVERQSVARYWSFLWEQQEYEAQTYLAKWDYIEDILRSGSPAQVRALRCPQTGGPMRIQYMSTKENPPYFKLSTAQGRFLSSPIAPDRPSWLDVLGDNFVTEPPKAEQDAAPNGGPASSFDDPGATEEPPSMG